MNLLQTVSANQDSFFIGGQGASRSYEHHMRDGQHGEDEDFARAEYDIFLASNLADALVAVRTDRNAALTALGKSFHAIADGTSPAHSCMSLPKAPTCGSSTEDFRPWNPLDLHLVFVHISEESDPAHPGIGRAVALIRNYYQANFGTSVIRNLTSHAGVSISGASGASVLDLASTLGAVSALGGGIF